MPILEIENFRKKYPEYNDMDDGTLADSLAAKYPDAYGDLPAKVKQIRGPAPEHKEPFNQDWFNKVNSTVSSFKDQASMGDKALQALIDAKAFDIAPSDAFQYGADIDKGVKINPLAPSAVKRGTMMQRVKQAWDIGMQQKELGTLGWEAMMNADPAADAKLDSVSFPAEKDMIFAEEGETDLGEWLMEAIKMTPMMGHTAIESVKSGLGAGTLAGTVVGLMSVAGPQVVASPITVPMAASAGFAAGATSKAFEESMKFEGGLAYAELRKMTDPNGQPIDRNVARAASFGIGAINGAIEVSQIKTLLKTIPGADKLLKRSILEVVKNPTVKQRLFNLALSYSGMIGSETGQEIVQESTNIVFEELAKQFNNNKKGTSFEGPDADKIMDRLWETAEAAAKGFAAMGLPGTVAKAGMTVMPQRGTKAAPGGAGVTQGPTAQPTATPPTILGTVETPQGETTGFTMADPETGQTFEVPAIKSEDANGIVRLTPDMTAVQKQVETIKGEQQALIDEDTWLESIIQGDEDITEETFTKGVMGNETVQVQGQEGIGTEGQGEKVGIVEQAAAILTNNRGSIDLEPIVNLARSIYAEGKTTLETFTARAKELLGEVWDKVKDLVRQAWDVVNNERGSISNKPIKDAFTDRDYEVLAAWAKQFSTGEAFAEALGEPTGDKTGVWADLGFTSARDFWSQAKRSLGIPKLEQQLDDDFVKEENDGSIEVLNAVGAASLSELEGVKQKLYRIQKESTAALAEARAQKKENLITFHQNRLAGVQKAFATVKARIRDITGQIRHADDKQVGEYEALKAALKKAEQASKIAYKAGQKDVVKAEAKKIKSLKQQIKEFTGQRTDEAKTVTEYQALTASFQKAAQAARVAYRGGNKEGVAKAKEQMKQALTRAKEIKKGKAARAKDIKAIKKLSEMKGDIAVDYQKRIKALTSDLDFKNISPAKWKEMQDLADFIEREGVPLGINPKRLSELKRLTAIPVKSLTDEQIKALKDQLVQLTALGKLKAKLKFKHKAEARAKIMAEIVRTTNNLDWMPTPLKGGKERVYGTTRSMAADVFLDTLFTPRAFDIFDKGQKYKGVQSRLGREFRKAEQNVGKAADDRNQRFMDFLEKNNIELPETGSDRDIAMIINMRIREGSSWMAESLMKHYGIDSVPNLTHDEEQIIEWIRQDQDNNKPELAAVWEEMFEEIFPERAVYYLPAKYEGETELTRHIDTEGRGRTTHTFSGMGIERKVGVKQLPRVGVAELYAESIMEQEWFKKVGPVIEDVKSVVLTDEYKAAAGEVQHEYWKTHIDIMARRGWTASAHLTAVGEWLAKRRHNIASSILAFKAITILAQPFAVLDAMAFVNAYYGPVDSVRVGAAVLEAFVRPGWAKSIIEGSEALKQRQGGELAIEEELNRKDESIKDKINRVGFKLIQKTDVMTAAGVQEAVRKILLKRGITEEQAKEEAEFVMEMSQSSGSIAYRPHILAKGEGYRTWMTFQNFMMNRWNILIHDIVMGKIVKGEDIKGRMIGIVSLGLFMLGGLAEDEARRRVRSLYSNPKEDKRGIFEKVFVNTVGLIPFLGNIITGASEKRDAVPPVVSIGAATVQGGYQMVAGKKTETQVKGGLKLAEGVGSLFFGIPGLSQGFDLIEGAMSDSKGENR